MIVTLEYERVGDCWLYIGALNTDGYGHIQIDGKRSQVHRLVYEQFVEPLAARKAVRHSCENRSCIRIDHLFVSKHKKNPAGYRRRSVCKHGHALTDDNIIQTQAGRVCKKCRTAYKAAWYQRKRAENAKLDKE